MNIPSAESVTVTNTLSVDFSDGRSLSVPLAWFPRLVHATATERKSWRLIGQGRGIHWEKLDEDITWMGSWPAKNREKVGPRSRSGSPPAKAPEPDERGHAQVSDAASDRLFQLFDSDEFIFLGRCAGYTTDNWQAGARHLQTDIEKHMTLTKQLLKGRSESCGGEWGE